MPKARRPAISSKRAATELGFFSALAGLVGQLLADLGYAQYSRIATISVLALGSFLTHLLRDRGYSFGGMLK